MSSFSEGYTAFAKSAGANLAAFQGSDYIESVERAIAELADSINNPGRKIDKASVDSVKGFMAEKWHAGTHNVDAAAKGVRARAYAPDDNGLVDIHTSWGGKYQSKVNANPRGSVNELLRTEQGHFLRNHKGAEYKGDAPNRLYYEGQSGLIASDKMEESKKILERGINENRQTRPEVAENEQKVLEELTDKITGPKGSESMPLSEPEAKLLAQHAKDENFDPAEWEITPAQRIEWKHIGTQALKAGLTAAVISVVLELAPEIIRIISKRIKTGEIDIEDFRRLGFAAAKGSVQGFVRGMIASAITIACQAGRLGEVLESTPPTIIGTAVALTMNALQNATLMAFGKMTKQEFANCCVKDLLVASCSLALGAVVALLPGIPAIAFLLGSFVGSVVGDAACKAVYNCALSFCVDTGCTFFGLVEQDYTLPNDMLKELGVSLFEYEKAFAKRLEPKRFEVRRFEEKTIAAKSINITVLRRGVIGVSGIGYI